MANGLWGSKYPVVNYISTHLIFLAVRYRINYLKLKNKIRSATNPRQVTITNQQRTYTDFENLLEMGYKKINIGGGHRNLEGFINIDFVSSPLVKIQVVANILDLSFIKNECLTQIHSNHLIKHLDMSDLQKQASEWYRILMEDGILTIRCPNILGASYGFWFEPVLETDKEEFMRLGFPPDEVFCNKEDVWLHKDLFGLLHWFYGDVGNITNQHLNQITPTKLSNVLNSAGFTIVKITNPESLNIAVIAIKKTNK
jgi:hypothetical protein